MTKPSPIEQVVAALRVAYPCTVETMMLPEQCAFIRVDVEQALWHVSCIPNEEAGLRKTAATLSTFAAECFEEEGDIVALVTIDGRDYCVSCESQDE